ncbi:hypothetical protein L195_g050831, partial [Trifolium pratense]
MGNLQKYLLHGDLAEDIYMTLPPGLPSSSEGVCKLKRSLYGLDKLHGH